MIVEYNEQSIELLDFKKGEELTGLYMKTEFIFLVDVFEKLINVSTKKYEINPLYCVSICGYTYQCGLKLIDIKLQTPQDTDMILLEDNIIRGGIKLSYG